MGTKMVEKSTKSFKMLLKTWLLTARSAVPIGVGSTNLNSRNHLHIVSNAENLNNPDNSNKIESDSSRGPAAEGEAPWIRRTPSGCEA